MERHFQESIAFSRSLSILIRCLVNGERPSPKSEYQALMSFMFVDKGKASQTPSTSKTDFSNSLKLCL